MCLTSIISIVPHLSFVRGSPPPSGAPERGRFRSLLLIMHAGGSLEESAAGRGVSLYRPARFEAPSTARNQLARIYGPSRHPTSAGARPRTSARRCSTARGEHAQRLDSSFAPHATPLRSSDSPGCVTNVRHRWHSPPCPEQACSRSPTPCDSTPLYFRPIRLL